MILASTSKQPSLKTKTKKANTQNANPKLKNPEEKKRHNPIHNKNRYKTNRLRFSMQCNTKSWNNWM